MKKLLKTARIQNVCVFLVISVLCVQVSCVTVPSVYNARDREGSNTGTEDYHDGLDDLHKVPSKTDSQTIKVNDERRVRNFISDHEMPKEIPTKLKIVGDMATPTPNSNIKLDFVPKQTYVQVRRYDTEVHLPKSEALAEAETAEEVQNAPRLREVVSHTKKQEVSLSNPISHNECTLSKSLSAPKYIFFFVCVTHWISVGLFFSFLIKLK